jgi:hypothetical protein
MSNRDPFAVAIEQFLTALSAEKRLPDRRRGMAFMVAWKLTTFVNRQLWRGF